MNNIFFAISINIHVWLKAGFVVQSHIWFYLTHRTYSQCMVEVASLWMLQFYNVWITNLNEPSVFCGSDLNEPEEFYTVPLNVTISSTKSLECLVWLLMSKCLS